MANGIFNIDDIKNFAGQAKTGVFNANDPNEQMINSGEASTLLNMAKQNNTSPDELAKMLGVSTQQVINRLQTDYPTLSADYLGNFGFSAGTADPSKSYLNAGQTPASPSAVADTGTPQQAAPAATAPQATNPAQTTTASATPQPAAPGNLGTMATNNTGNSQLPTNPTPTGYPTPIPGAPNYQGAAAAQGSANLDAAKNTVALSNPDINTPYGSQTVSVGPDGRPVVNQNLSPEQQQRLDQLNSVLTGAGNSISSELANSLRSYVTQEFGAPSLDNLSARTVDPSVGGVTTIADALRKREQPRMDRQRQQAEAQLIARGFNPNDESYKAAMDEINRSENDFNLGLLDKAGNEQSRLFNLESSLRGQQADEQSQLFGQQLTRRQNQVNEGQILRGLPLQEYQQLLQLLPNLPQFKEYQGATVDAAPVFNAANEQGIFDLGRYQTMIQGELGTRGVDSGIKQGNWDIALRAAGL